MPVKRPSRLPALAVPLLMLAGLALIVTLTGGGSKSRSPATGAEAGAGEFDGAALPIGAPAAPFTLTDQNGRSVSLRSRRGRPLVLAFMYPGCGATCVLIAEQIRGAENELRHPVPVVIVDAGGTPASPAARMRFLREVSLSGRASYLSGAPGALRKVWRDYSVTPASAGASAFDQNAELRLLDAAGRERVLYGLEQLSPEALSHDIGRLEGRSPEGG